MQAVILAAGKGTRLRPLTYQKPKPLLLLNNNLTILERTLKEMPQTIKEVVIVVNYLQDMIKDKFGSYYQKKKITYITHQKLDGTAGALFQCKSILKDDFLILHGDDLYFKKDLEKISQESLALLACKKKGTPSGGKIVVDKDYLLQEIIDYPEENLENYLLNTGAYKLNREIFSYTPKLINKTSKEFGLPQTLAIMAKDFPIKVIMTKKYFQINSLEDLEKAKKEVTL